LAKYRENILDMELIQSRIAWSAVDLYAMAAVISRLQLMIETTKPQNGHAAQYHKDLIVGRGFCHRAADRTMKRLRELFRNQDEDVVRVADAVLGTGILFGRRDEEEHKG